MYKVGDVVRLMDMSYFDLAKSGMMQPNRWKEADQTHDTYTMLGGRYTVLEAGVLDNGMNVYTLIKSNSLGEPPSRAGDSSLVLDKDVENCPYQARRMGGA